MGHQINLKYSINHPVTSDQTNYALNFTMNNHTNNNMYIVHKAIRSQLTEKRFGNANTKTKSEVRGGGKKPWKQKGTGRARAGSTRSPLWKNGGIIFGPKTKKYTIKINKKEKILAIKTLIYNKYSQTILIDNISNTLKEPKTKIILEKFTEYGISKKIYNKKILLIVDNITKNLYLSLRNKTNIELITAYNLNSLSLVKAEKILITKEALIIINNIYQ